MVELKAEIKDLIHSIHFRGRFHIPRKAIEQLQYFNNTLNEMKSEHGSASRKEWLKHMWDSFPISYRDYN